MPRPNLWMIGLVCACLLGLQQVAYAQTSSSIYRYDVQNATSAEPAMTFLLDTATGKCWEMLMDETGLMVGMARIKVTPMTLGKATEIGRFRLVASSGKRTGTFLLDTSTGYLWAWGLAGGRSSFNLLPVEGVREQ